MKWKAAYCRNVYSIFYFRTKPNHDKLTYLRLLTFRYKQYITWCSMHR